MVLVARTRADGHPRSTVACQFRRHEDRDVTFAHPRSRRIDWLCYPSDECGEIGAQSFTNHRCPRSNLRTGERRARGDSALRNWTGPCFLSCPAHCHGPSGVSRWMKGRKLVLASRAEFRASRPRACTRPRPKLPMASELGMLHARAQREPPLVQRRPPASDSSPKQPSFRIVRPWSTCATFRDDHGQAPPFPSPSPTSNRAHAASCPHHRRLPFVPPLTRSRSSRSYRHSAAAPTPPREMTAEELAAARQNAFNTLTDWFKKYGGNAEVEIEVHFGHWTTPGETGPEEDIAAGTSGTFSSSSPTFLSFSVPLDEGEHVDLVLLCLGSLPPSPCCPLGKRPCARRADVSPLRFPSFPSPLPSPPLAATSRARGNCRGGKQRRVPRVGLCRHRGTGTSPSRARPASSLPLTTVRRPFLSLLLRVQRLYYVLSKKFSHGDSWVGGRPTKSETLDTFHRSGYALPFLLLCPCAFS